jgi:hypothetical protein
VAGEAIDDGAFVLVDHTWFHKDEADQYLNAFTAQFLAARALGQPVVRVRVSSNIASRIIGREGTPLVPGEVVKFMTCGADREDMELWEDEALAPSTAYVE